jgi:hypothetical protein
MHWPKPGELRRWAPDDQQVFKKWRGAFLRSTASSEFWFSGAMLALHHNPNAKRDGVVVSRGRVLQQTIEPSFINQVTTEGGSNAHIRHNGKLD